MIICPINIIPQSLSSFNSTSSLLNLPFWLNNIHPFIEMLSLGAIFVMTLSMSLGNMVSALPQTTTKPTSISLSGPAASSIVAANPMVFPPQNATKVPIPGAPSNSTLLAVVPELKTTTKKPHSTSGKRDVPVSDMWTRIYLEN